MNKKILILLLLIVAGSSGCTIKPTSDGTWGEKTISLDKIKVLNNTTSDNDEYEGINYFYIEGYVQNNNKWNAFKVKMKATAYDKNGKVVAVNDTVYLDPKSIPASGQSYFNFLFIDQNRTIKRYDVELVDAKVNP